MSYLSQDPAFFGVATVVAVMLVLRMLYNLVAYGRLFGPAIRADVDGKHRYKVSAGWSWTTDFVPPGRTWGGYDVLVPGPVSIYWWFFTSGRSSFTIQNLSKEVLEFSWGPNGGGDPRTQYWGTVTLAPGCKATVQIMTWHQGVVFGADVSKAQKVV